MSAEKETESLNIFNHLTVDDRMKFVSPFGLGETNFNPLSYVDMCLSPRLPDYVPQGVRDMFDRAKAIMSYGVYHYPLFTAGMESIYGLLEAALYHCAFDNGCTLSERQAMFGALLKYCEQNKLIVEPALTRWEACRHMRNMVSHQKSHSLYFPNTAVHSLQIAKELIEALFIYGPPNLLDFYERSARRQKRDEEFREYLRRQDAAEANL